MRPFLLDKSNYTNWKARMRSFQSSIDTHMWTTVEYDCKHPTMEVNGGVKPKPVTDWEIKEYKCAT